MDEEINSEWMKTRSSLRLFERMQRKGLTNPKVVEEAVHEGSQRKSFRIVEDAAVEVCSRKSFRAAESEDVVPVTTRRAYELLETESTSSTTCSDSSTPDFPSVIIVLNSLDEDLSPEEDKKTIPRVSKMFYDKLKMEIIYASVTEDSSMITEYVVSSSISELNAYDNALELLKKFNFENYNINPSQNIYESQKKDMSSLLSLDFNEQIVNNSDLSCDILMVDKENDANQSKKSNSLKDSMENEQRLHLNPSEDILLIESKNEKVNKNENIKDMGHDRNRNQKKQIPTNKTVQIRTVLLDEIFNRTIDDSKFEEKRILNIEESKEKLVNKIMAKTTHKDISLINFEKSMKNSKINFLSKCADFPKEIKPKEKNTKYQTIKNVDQISLSCPYREFSKNNPKAGSLKPFNNLVSILFNNTKPVSTYKVPWEKLVLNGDVIILRKGIIININDIVDSIGSTIILRDLGILMLSEGKLINQAIEIVKFKSEILKILISKKFPILKDIKMIEFQNTNQNVKVMTKRSKTSIKYTRKSKQKLNIFNIVLSINGLLKSSSTFPASTKWINKTSHMKEMIWKFQSASIYSDTIKSNLNSLKRCIKIHSMIEL